MGSDLRGVATETIRVAGLAPFVVMKTLAHEDRVAEKDAYDLVYCPMLRPEQRQRRADSQEKTKNSGNSGLEIGQNLAEFAS